MRKIKLSSRRMKINSQEQAFLKKLRRSTTEARERVIEDMKFHNFSLKTQNSYLDELLRLTARFRKSPAYLTDEDLRNYFRYRQKCGYSPSSLGIAHAALTFYYTHSNPQDMPFLKLFRAGKNKSLPVVLSREEVKLILNKVRDERYRCCLKLIYCCGLRASEAVKIEVDDIYSKQGLLLVRKGKGNKDRFVPLPTSMLKMLREIWAKHRHPRYLFPAYKINLQQTPKRYGAKNKPVSTSTLSTHFKTALNATGCRKKASLHSLRHSYGTHLLEENVPIFTVKEYMGHSSISSTLIYSHCTGKIRRQGHGSVESLMQNL